jgi:hypothetical protein
MEAPQTYKDKRYDIEEESSDIEVHVVTADSNGTWRPVTKESNVGCKLGVLLRNAGYWGGRRLVARLVGIGHPEDKMNETVKGLPDTWAGTKG